MTITRRAALGALLATPSLAIAQEMPRTISLVVPFSAGSVVDIMARPFADGLRQALGGGTSVVVLNRDGGGGSVGAQAVASARPDGATLFFGPSGMLTVRPFLQAGLPYEFGALDPVCQTFENIFVMLAAANSPLRTLRDVVEAARARPEALNWGDAGVGTVGFLIMKALERQEGIRMTHVPYRNSPQQMLDTVTGALSVSLTTWATARGQDVRVLGVAADARQPLIPDGPTFKEQGFDVSWRGFGGIMVPRGTPAALVRRLEAACAEAVRWPGHVQVAESTGQVIPFLGAEDFGARLRREHEAARDFLAELGLRPQ
ncbi:Bug family tripartite tricarboxylate transporter substrate binding protein [Roseococcus sp. DSY-14]|uniref:Bug family tripartite tricarboxylate transporter substrate binding protein n=1 Tax=Roseococcus sp. DSY-14 TaxID=3369650 RepID=UPI00387AC606